MMMKRYRHRLTTLWRRAWPSSKSGGISADDSEEPRIVHCNERSRNDSYGYTKNKTSTTKYTFTTFLPKSLFVQYRRAAYWFFTTIAVLSLTPFSPHSSASIIVPLTFVLTLGIGREFWEDLRRYRGDKVVNAMPSQVLQPGGGETIEILPWKDLQVGDLVRVSDGEYFPADLLLLSSSGPDGVCYVETKNLDGESNLKVRNALESTWNLSETSLGSFRAEVKCEQPNASLYTFTGRIELQDGQSFPVGPAQLLLRESSLQNTGDIWGVVIYAGDETKVMQNATAPPNKRSRIDKSLDKVVYAMLTILLFMSFASGAVLGYRTDHASRDMWYLMPFDPSHRNYYNPGKAVIAALGITINGLILYGYLVPIGLYISLEMVRIFQGFFIMLDSEMFEPKIAAGATVRSVGLNEELGQVDIILSDKTGTLTCNQMDFFRCSIAGVSYGTGETDVGKAVQRLGVARNSGVEASITLEGEDAGKNHSRVKGFNFSDPRLLDGNWSQEANPDVVQLFFQILALCHTGIPEGDVAKSQAIEYRAESPDEAALIVAAKQFGFCFYKRTPSALHVRESIGRRGEYRDQAYELLSVLEFSSARKRMSVIVRFPDGRVMLLSKGADSVMIQRVDRGNKKFLRSTMDQLKQYAEEGLRTLVVAYRELDEAEFQNWQIKYAKACRIIGYEKEERMNEVADEIERNLVVVGATGVEDKLQVGVPETIDHLAQAGISIWVLTGDKVETAINIGYASSLLRKGTQKIIVTLGGSEAREVEERVEKENLSSEHVNKALTSIVAQRLSEGNMEIERIRKGLGVQNSGKRSVVAESEMYFDSFESFSGNMSGRLTPTHSEGEHELQELNYSLNQGSKREPTKEASSLQDAKEQKNHQLDDFGGQNMTGRGRHHSNATDEEPSFALVIDGNSLAFILVENGLQKEFMQVCKQCVSVLCCRMSPQQKAQVTKLVRKEMGEDRLCLAIGDGANDVGMIQAANVGVGMTGVEGAQAAMAADYTIGQFRFLERLLLVHGHWCYRRISLMILYYYYKVCLIGWIAFCSNAFGFFSGQPLYNDWYASFYNSFFTAAPVCVVGTLDQDVSAVDCVGYPQLYRAGHRKQLFNWKLVTLWMLNSLYSGLLLFFFPVGLSWLGPFRADGQIVSLPEFGVILCTGLVLVPNVQLTLAINYFTWIHHATIWGSIALWYLFLLVYGALPLKLQTPYPTTPYKVLIEAVGPSAGYWILQLLVVVAAILPSFLVRSFKSTFYPSDYQIVSEITARESRQQSTAAGEDFVNKS